MGEIFETIKFLFTNKDTAGITVLMTLVGLISASITIWSIVRVCLVRAKRQKYAEKLKLVNRDMTYADVVALLGEPLDLTEFDNDKIYYIWAMYSFQYYPINTESGMPFAWIDEETNGIRIAFREDKIVAIQYLKV